MNKSNFQIFIESFVATLLSILKVLLFFKPVRNNFTAPIKSKCIILGNGPSLDNSIHEYEDELHNYELICVNMFPVTKLYIKLKPKYLVIVAPELWMEDVNEEEKKKSELLFNAIVNFTTWKLNLIVPVLAKKSSWMNLLRENKFININFINTVPIEGFKWFKHAMFKRYVGMPRPHNVLIPSILLAINLDFREVYLLGADHSWLPEIKVDNSNNVLMGQKHFYDYEPAHAKPMTIRGKGKRNMHELLHKFVHTFHAYFILEKFAKNNNTRIFNATPVSYIDAFERKKLI